MPAHQLDVKRDVAQSGRTDSERVAELTLLLREQGVAGSNPDNPSNGGNYQWS